MSAMADPEDESELDDIDINNNNTITNNNGIRDSSQLMQQPQSNARRFSGWILLFVANLVSIIAIALGRRKDTSAEKWAKSLLAVSLAFSLLGSLCYHQFARSIFMSEPFEMGVSIFIFILWCAGLPIIMNPANSIAVGYTQIVNANLYLGSWVCFFCIFWIVGDLLGELYGYNDVTGFLTPHIQTRQGKWYALVATSLVVMGASVRVFQSFECDLKVMKAAPVCKDSKIAISVSVIATLISIIFTLIGYLCPGVSIKIAEYIGALLMVIFWSVGLGYITFGEGPGHSLGNLFFATWCAFLLSGWIAGECFLEWRATHNGSSAGSTDAVEEQQGRTELSDLDSSGANAQDVHSNDTEML